VVGVGSGIVAVGQRAKPPHHLLLTEAGLYFMLILLSLLRRVRDRRLRGNRMIGGSGVLVSVPSRQQSSGP
jgi:hypothetical protein